MGQGGPGRPRELSKKDILGIFDNRDDIAEPKTATEIAKHFDTSQRTVRNRLNEMSGEGGSLKTKKVSANARVWWVPMPKTEHQPDSN